MSGGIGRDIALSQLDSVLRQAGISMQDYMTEEERKLLISSISRYPGTNRVNAQLFLHILAYWSNLSDKEDKQDVQRRFHDPQHSNSNYESNSDEQAKPFATAIAYMKAKYPEISYVFDLMTARLQSVLKNRAINKTKITIEEFDKLMIKIDLVMSKTDRLKYLDILSRARIYNKLAEDIDMNILMQLLNYIKTTSQKVSVIESPNKMDHNISQDYQRNVDNAKTYSLILNRIRDDAKIIRARINAYNRMYNQDTDTVNMNVFYRSILDSGIQITDRDMRGFWHQLFASDISSTNDTIPISSLDKKIFSVIFDQSRTSLSDISEEKPYQRQRKGSIREVTRAPFALDHSKEIKGEKVVYAGHAVNKPTIVMHKHQESNLQQRIVSRIKVLSPSQRNQLIRDIIALDKSIKDLRNVFNRYHISKILLHTGVRVNNIDCDEIWNHLCQGNDKPSLQTFAAWLDLDLSTDAGMDHENDVRDSLNHFLPFRSKHSNNIPSQSPSDRPDSIFQFVNGSVDKGRRDSHYNNRASSDIPPWDVSDELEDQRSQPIDPTTYDADRVLVSQEDISLSRHQSERGYHPQLVEDGLQINREHDRYDMHNRVDHPSHFDSSTNRKTSERAVDFTDDQYIIDDTRIREYPHQIQNQQEHKTWKRSAAILRLQQNRPNLAFLFRKLLGSSGRLDENTVSCQRFAEALLGPPVNMLDVMSSHELFELVCGMTNPSYDYSTAVSSDPRLYFRDVLRYLDEDQETNDISPAVNGLSYRHNFLIQSIKSKLLGSAEVKGDRLKLLALCPKLKARYKSIRSKGKRVSSWDMSGTDVCSEFDLKELLQFIDVNLNLEEIKFIFEQIIHQETVDTISKDVGNTHESVVGDRGIRVGDAIVFLSELLVNE